MRTSTAADGSWPAARRAAFVSPPLEDGKVIGFKV